MRNRIICFQTLLSTAVFAAVVCAPSLYANWTRTFGGSCDDCGEEITRTADGGYIVLSTEWCAAESIHLWKLQENGFHDWDQSYGFSQHVEVPHSVKQNTNGDYIVAGGIAIDGEQTDFFLMKVHANGNMAWFKTFGSPYSNDEAYDVEQKQDGGYILAGKCLLSGETVIQAYIVETDPSGNVVREKWFGGANLEYFSDIEQISDGRYVLTGSIQQEYDRDVWVVKLNTQLDLVWSQSVGGSEYDQGFSIKETPNGRYIVAGRTDSYGAGGSDAYLIKLYTGGIVQDEAWYGGPGDDAFYSVDSAPNGGFYCAGERDLKSAGGLDCWAVKIDDNLIMKLQKTFGGVGNDRLKSCKATTAVGGGCVVTGRKYLNESVGEQVIAAQTLGLSTPLEH